MDKIKLGILGLNYDTEAGRGWPGARYAPDSIRRALSGIMNRVEDGYLFDVCNNKLINLNQFEIKDFGNTDQICHYSHVQALKEMSECIQKVISSGFIPILLGGDHSVTNAGFDVYIKQQRGRLGLLISMLT